MSARRVLAVAILLATGLGYSSGAPAGNPGGSAKQPQAAIWKPHAITVSRQTTYVEGPLDKDGRIDYLAAMNLHCRRGITPENNAALLIYPLLGPDVVPARHREEFFRQLGLQCRPARERRFRRLTEYAAARAAATGGQPGGDRPGRDSSSLPEIATSRDLEGSLGSLCEKPLRPEEQPVLAEWLEANRQALDTIAAAGHRPRFWVPVVLDQGAPLYEGIDTAYGVEAIWEVAQGLLVRAMLRLGAGQIDDAWGDLARGYRLARLASWGHTEFDVIRAIRWEYAATQAIAVLSHDRQMTAGQAARFLADLDALPARQCSAETESVFRRFTLLDMLVRLARSGSIPGDGTGTRATAVAAAYRVWGAAAQIDFDEALRTANAYFDQTSRFQKGSARSEFQRQVAAWQEEVARNEKNLQGPASGLVSVFLSPTPGKAAGRQIAWKLLSLTSQPVAVQRYLVEDVDARVQMARLALALGGYRADHHGYPEALSALSPTYLQGIPVDWFSGSPYRYRRLPGGYVLYSVGVNGRDDGGVQGQNLLEGDCMLRPLTEPR